MEQFSSSHCYQSQTNHKLLDSRCTDRKGQLTEQWINSTGDLL